jgi:hypothetical protein
MIAPGALPAFALVDAKDMHNLACALSRRPLSTGQSAISLNGLYLLAIRG